MSNIAAVKGYMSRRQPNEYSQILTAVQGRVKDDCWEIIGGSTSPDRRDRLLAFIMKELEDNGYFTEQYAGQELAERLYNDIDRYSILTPYLSAEDVEEININAWNDVQIKYCDGRTEKAEHFLSPRHAEDVVKRLLQESGTVLDNAVPVAEGRIGGNIRITAVKTPVLDETVGVCASIRILQKRTFRQEQYLETGFASQKELDFLALALRYGVSTLIVGRVSSGKTTFENYLLSTIPDEKKIVTIESGARELNLVKTGEQGEILNNVVHLLARPKETPEQNISQEKLVVATLRLAPDVISVAEMRDTEAYAAQEASLTGHTVVSTLHAGSPRQAHQRIASLCRKVYPVDFHTALLQACEAFPLVVFIHQGEDYVRRILEVAEAVVDGERITYRTLFRFDVQDNQTVGGKTVIQGSHRQAAEPSEQLKQTMMLYGVPRPLLDSFDLEKS